MAWATTPPMHPVMATSPLACSAIASSATGVRPRRPRIGVDVPSAMHQADEVLLVPLVAGRQEREVVGVSMAAAAVRLGPQEHVELRAEDGLHPLLLGGLVERDRAEHVGVVGDRHRAHPRRAFTSLRTRSFTFTAPSSIEYCVWAVEVDELRHERIASRQRGWCLSPDTGAIASSGSVNVQEYVSLALLALAWSRTKDTSLPSRRIGGTRAKRAPFACIAPFLEGKVARRKNLP